MEETDIRIVSDDGVELAARRWIPDAAAFPAPRAVVQLVHGLAEHSLRYRPLAERLCAAGFEVWADDHRGHGLTARGSLLGHTADKDGFFRVVRDLFRWSGRIRVERPGVPLFLVGHSWGSYLAQAYIEQDASGLAGCALSGSRGPGGGEVAAGAALAALIAFLFGPRRHSPLLKSLAEGSFNRSFAPNRTPFDWLSRDELVVDAYASDPLCGFGMSAGFYRDLARGLAAVHRREAIARIPKTLPVYVVSGSRDPAGLDGKSTAALVETYRAAGLVDLEYVLYPDARHEVFNETNRNEVIGALVSWLDRHLAGAA